jgi:signal transduction histidine kinase
MKRGALDYLIKDVHFQDFVPTHVHRALDQIERDRKLVIAEKDRMRLEQQIIEISERERRRIGQDLHDGLGQHLTGIELMTEALEQKLLPKHKTEAARASDIARHVREAIRQTRSLARGLSPVEMDSKGLMVALKALSDNASDMFRIVCRFHCPAEVSVGNNVAATHLFRIAQEAVSNAIKHGHAQEVVIQLNSTANQVKLTITDDGQGIPPAEKRGNGMGLRIMHYRATVAGGTLTVTPGEDSGTIVTCVVPKIALEETK